jgi:hydrophobic/amphiphilic exporter-1 (mainly G- bacteria), HAE1 family
MLAGIVVNNAILLVDYTNTAAPPRRHAADDAEAVVESARRRLRPILMTTPDHRGPRPACRWRSVSAPGSRAASAALARVVIGGDAAAATFITGALEAVTTVQVGTQVSGTHLARRLQRSTGDR